MKLQQLKAFLLTLDKGNFSEAALELGNSQSTVSYAVAELEKDLGAKLLRRGRFGAEATEVGLRVAAHARGVLRLTEAMQQEADFERGIVRGTLRLATFRSVAGRIIPRMIAQLKREYPQLTFQLTEIDNDARSKLELVAAHEVDLAFVDTPPHEDSEAISWEVTADAYFALLLAEDPRDWLCLRDLARTPLILSQNCGCGGNILHHLEAQGYAAVRPAYEVSADSTIVQMVAAGLGVGVLPELAIDTLPSSVKAVPLASALKRPIYLSLLPSSLKVPAVRIFLSALKTQFPESELPQLALPSEA